MQRVCKMPCCLQEVLPELYCGHDAFLFSSRYEAWGMPVLEAMAAGLAVVATACLGVDTFARHGMNALLAPPQVPTSVPPTSSPTPLPCDTFPLKIAFPAPPFPPKLLSFCFFAKAFTVQSLCALV